MSTIDSYFHVMGLTAIHDVLQPLYKNQLDEHTEVRYIRYATLLLSCVSICVVLTLQSKNYLALLVLSLELSGPLLMFPLFAGMMGLKADQRDFYAACVATLLMFMLTKFFVNLEDHFIALACTLANGIAFFGIHVYRHRGFAIAQTTVVQETIWRPQVTGIMTSLRNWLTHPEYIIAYSQSKVHKYGATYLPFGLFCCLNFIFPYFMWSHALHVMHDLMLYLRIVGAVFCALLIVKDKWPAALLPYLPTFWHLTLLYCLPFTSTIMFLLTQGSTEWLINVAVTIMFLIVLVDWLSFIILTILGVALGLLFHYLAIGPINLQLDFSTGYLLVYTCIFSTLIAMLFARCREQHLEAKLREISAHYHATRQVATADPEPAIYRIAAMIERNVQEVNASYRADRCTINMPWHEDEALTSMDCLQYFFPTAIEVIQQGAQLMPHLLAVLRQDYINPYLSSHSLQACVDTVLQAYGTNQVNYVQEDLAADYAVYASWPHLQYAIIHVLQFLLAHLNKEPIHLWMMHQQGIHMRLAGKALADSVLHELFELFPAKGTTHHLGLAISKVLIEAHGGSLLYQTHASTQQPYTAFTIALPPAVAY